MLALTLLSAAHAADLQAHVGVALAATAFLDAQEVAPRMPTRFELGAGTPAVQGYVVGQLTVLNSPQWWYADADEPNRLVGDALLTQLGLGARAPVRVFGGLHVVPHGELGLAVVRTPIEAEALAEEAGDYPFPNPPTTVGGFVQAGADLGGEVVPDAVVLTIGPEVGYLLVADLGLTFGVRVAASARF